MVMYKRGAALNVDVNRCIRTETGLMLVEIHTRQTCQKEYLLQEVQSKLRILDT